MNTKKVEYKLTDFTAQSKENKNSSSNMSLNSVVMQKKGWSLPLRLIKKYKVLIF